MKEKDPVVQRLTTWTMYLIFGLFAALLVSGAVYMIIELWRRILGG